MLTPRGALDKLTAGEMTLVDAIDAVAAWKADGEWVIANGGTETPFFTANRRRLLYVYQPRSGRHAYLDVQTDLILSDNDAMMALGVM
jgi:hypothetical protein